MPSVSTAELPKRPFEQTWTVAIRPGSAPIKSAALRIEHLDDMGRKVSRVIARGGAGASTITGKYTIVPGISYRLIASAIDASGTLAERHAGSVLIPR